MYSFEYLMYNLDVFSDDATMAEPDLPSKIDSAQLRIAASDNSEE